MATSLRDLLDRARLDADHSPATIPAAQAAITALGHVGRALHTLIVNDDRPRKRSDPDQLRLAAKLARDTASAAVGWAPTGGRLPDLAGAAADVIGRLAPGLDATERWAVTVAVAETARHCADTARLPPTYRRLPMLIEARAAAAAVEQRATADPPSTVSRVILDRLIPLSDLDAATPAASYSIEAAAGLIGAVRSAVSRGELTVGDALAAVTAARFAASHAVDFADQFARHGAPPRDWQAAPVAWRAVQLSYVSIDDGTKHSSPTSSTVIAWAVRLHDGLHAHFASPPSPAPAAPPPHGPGSGHQGRLDQRATVLRAVTNQFPELARLLERSTETWTRSQSVYAPQRRLASYEQHNVTGPTPANAPDRIVAVQPGDLAGTITALRDAERLSASLSAELDHTSHVYGHQPQPYLAAAHRAETVQSTPLARARRAQAATRRGAASQPSDWTLPPRPGRGR